MKDVSGGRIFLDCIRFGADEVKSEMKSMLKKMAGGYLLFLKCSRISKLINLRFYLDWMITDAF